jgi:hypothetical protein
VIRSAHRSSFPVELELNPGSVVRIITRAGETMKVTAERDSCRLDVEMRIEGADFMRVGPC